MKIRQECEKCQGDGWNIDHSDRHYQTEDSESCDQAGCPIQRPCGECNGQGYIEFEV
jgi:DnaJ-class molecular chaperone